MIPVVSKKFQVGKAYETAKHTHGRRRPAASDRFLTHTIEVAAITAGHGGTTAAVSAVLLHDVVEEAGIPLDELHADFGSGLASMVDGLAGGVLCNISADRDLILVAAADRLHNLRHYSGYRPSVGGVSLDTLVHLVPIARKHSCREIATELTDPACAQLAFVNRHELRTFYSNMAFHARKFDPAAEVEMVTVLGGGVFWPMARFRNGR